ncbi:MAG TPA: hypothetical protein VJ917_00925 [Saprospiraceae bacterium]|nr:hypothetical protein [Saprospiraceae bacterium]
MVFKEKQYFTQWWLWLILLAATTPLFLMALYKGPVLGHASQYSTVEFLVILACCILPFVFLKLIYLETKFDEQGIQLRFFPFIKKSWRWSEMKKMDMVNYGFVGGWGIRLWTEYGHVYNVKGDEGLAFELKNGKRYLVGTQRKEELQGFLNGIKGNDNFS